MKNNRFLKLIGGVTCVIALISGEAQASPEDDRRDYVIKTFLRDPLIQPILQDFDRQGLLREQPQTIWVGGGCGVAGCGYTSLVAQPYTTSGANPQTSSVFGLVSIDAYGTVAKVEQVILQPWQEILSGTGTQPAPQSAPFPQADITSSMPLLDIQRSDAPPPPTLTMQPIMTVPAPEPRIRVTNKIPATMPPPVPASR